MPIGLPNCSAALGVLDRQLERLLRDADGLRGQRCEGACARDRAVQRDLAVLVLALSPRDERLLVGRKLREREPHGGEVRAGVERAAELLEQDGLLDEAEAGAARLLGHRDAEPAELRQLVPRRLALVEQRARLSAQLVLLFREGESHLSTPREAEHALGDDVAEDLRRAGLDRVAARPELAVAPPTRRPRLPGSRARAWSSAASAPTTGASRRSPPGRGCPSRRASSARGSS